MKTQSQDDMETAARLVQDVASKESDGTKKIFGRLCHSFPIMVRTCGLCQALAFSDDKRTVPQGKTATDRHKAHKLLLKHVAELVGAVDENALLIRVRNDDLAAYMLDTRRVLSAWIYWKRFAVSILKVESARDKDNGNE